jgi:hypothetical protein
MERNRSRSTVSIAVNYGLILGVLSFVAFLLGTMAGLRRNWINAALLIVLMVLAHLKIRKTHDGMMTYPQGLGSGTLLASIAALISSVLVYVYVRFINTGYVATIVQTQRAALAQRGITGARAQQAMALTGMMTTPVGIAITSLIGGVVAGFIVALIVSIFTQKSDPRIVV